MPICGLGKTGKSWCAPVTSEVLRVSLQAIASLRKSRTRNLSWPSRTQFHPRVLQEAALEKRPET